MTEHDTTDQAIDPRELDPEIERLLIAQRRRRRAFEEGVYELADDEGFDCEDCNWRGLYAAVGDDVFRCVCPKCGGRVQSYNTTDTYLEPFKPDPGEHDA